jgi:AraC family transcriptional regulator, alkane utilization regulator
MNSQGVFDSARVARLTALEVELRAPWCCVVAPGNDTYLYVVRSGQCLLESDDPEAPLVLKAGDIVTLVGGQRHTLRDSARTSARPTIDGFARAAVKPEVRPRRAGPGHTRLLILSAPRDSNQFVSVYPALVAIPRTARESHVFLQRVLRLIEMELAADRVGKETVVRRLTEVVVIELVRFALPRLPRGGRNWLGGLSDQHIGRAIALMHSQVGKAWTLSSLSSAIGMSRAVFVERFTRLVGEPPNTYLRRVRMHRAATQLEESDDPIIKIAEAVGFRSESAFNKAFSKEMGMPPARYRRLHQRSTELS